MDSDHEQSLADLDITALAQRYLDGQLTAEQHSVLFCRLRTDTSAQKLFVRSLMQSAYLDELLAQHRSAHGDAIAGEGLQEPEVAVPIVPTRLEFTAPSDSTSAFGSPPPLSWLFGWGGLGLAMVALAATSMALLSGRVQKGDAKGPGELVAKGTISEVFDPRTIRLDSGSAKITLPKVGYMLVDGPADVELIAPLRAKLNRGRIRVRVTEPTGHGFVVETPDGDVADLSTEFGLDVSEGKKTGVVVFDGQVDLHAGKSAASNDSKPQRLSGGEGVTFNKAGELDRISSIATGRVATFQADDELAGDPNSVVIVAVSDNLRASDTRKFYEIVPGGLNEDSLSYVDRAWHEWNGVSAKGMPKYLIGADYVKTFNVDKTRSNMRIKVTLSRPADLYIFFDERLLVAPDWLKKGFRNTGDRIAMDMGPIGNNPVTPGDIGVGPANSLDTLFTIWKRTVKQPEVVTLGPNLLSRRNVGKGASMYGIAAVAIAPEQPVDTTTEKSTVPNEK